MYFNIGGGSQLPGSSIDTTVNRLARYSSDILKEIMLCEQFECNTSNVQTSSAQYFNSTNSTTLQHVLTLMTMERFK